MAEVPPDHVVADVIRVLIVDDHPVVRQGLRSFLSTREGIEVVGEAGDGEAALAEVVRLHPDVVLMDLVMPGAVAWPPYAASARTTPRSIERGTTIPTTGAAGGEGS